MWLIEADQKLFEYLTLNVNPPWLSALCERIGDLATYTYPVIVFAILYYWLNSPRFLRFALLCVLLLVMSEGTAYVLKTWVARPRPAIEWLIYVDVKAVGFPSAHSVNTMALAFFLSRWFGKPTWWYLPLPLLMGASRVLANYHYPLDVVGGWIIGLGVAILHWRLMRRWSGPTL